MAGRSNANDFLRAMNPGGDEAAAVIAPIAAVPTAPAEPAAALPARGARVRKAKAPASRADLKHFGGYVSEETNERIAILRVRLKLDNSELIKLAIDELHRKHAAKRAFGDV